ncbi:hypothetical protein ECG_02422 [Echinococcus granulosus]|nr:hypothetical protein ECG_02422 [Echinococcus granulosus]
MPEFYEYESTCTRCLRSSPLPSLLLMILVFLGGIAFGVGAIFGLRRLSELLNVDPLFPYMDYAIYAIVGATGLFVIIVYIICAISSGWNAKRCFEGTRATACGRCMNSTLLVCLIFAIFFWALVACLLTYPIMSGALLLYRDAGPARSLTIEEPLGRMVRQDEGGFGVTVAPRLSRVGGLDINPSEVIANFFTCDPTKVDLSYYGLYKSDGKPMMLDSTDLVARLRNPLIFVCVAYLGAITIFLSYIMLGCAVAMNFARLKELRYYEPSVNDDETIRLRH